MLRVALGTLRARWVSFLGTFVALLLGVTMITSMTLLLFTALFDLPHRAPQRFAAAPAVVFAEAPDWNPAHHDLGERSLPAAKGLSRTVVERVSAAGRVVVDRTFYAQLDGGPADSVGHPWPVAGYGGYALASGRPPGADREIVVGGGTGALAGGTVTVFTADGAQRFTVVGVTRGVGYEHPVFFTAHQAAVLSPRIDALVTDGPLEQVRAAVGGDAQVLTGDEKRLADASHAADLRSIDDTVTLLPVMASVAGSTAVFVIASTFAFAVIQRRREIALLRVLGGTPKQARRMVRAEALLVGTVASAAGALLGLAAANPLSGWLHTLGVTPAWFGVHPPYGMFVWLALLGGFGIGLLASLLGVVVASFRAARVRPIDALREASVDESATGRGRTVLGLAGLAAAVGVTGCVAFGDPAVTLSPTTYVSLLLVPILGAALAAPLLIGLLIRLLMVPFSRFTGATAMLVRQSALTARRRSAATAAPVLVTVGIAVSLLAATSSINTARDQGSRDRIDGQYTIVPEGRPGLSPELADRLSPVPGIDVFAPIDTTIYTPDGDRLQDNDAQVVDGATLAATARLPMVAGSLHDLSATTMIVPQAWGYAYGRTVPVTMADGRTVPLTVAAIYRAQRGHDVAYLAPRFAGTGRYAHNGLARRIHVRLRPGADRATVLAALRAAAAGEGAHVVTAQQVQQTDRSAGRSITAVRQRSVAVIVIAFCFIAILNTLLMANADRRRDLAILRLTGATPRQVVAAFAAESLLVGAAGVVLAVGASALSLAGLGFALHALFGYTGLVVPWVPVIAITACGVALAVVGAVLPAIWALRRSATEFAGQRE